MPQFDPWINRSSNSNTNIQNDNNDDVEYIEEKYLIEDNIDVFYNEDEDDFEENIDDDNEENQ
jgi:hypothetical protein